MENKIKIIVGTSNLHKIHEMNLIAKDTKILFCPIKEEGFDPVENGKNFEENAYIKAKEASKISKDGKLFLADDSGLCVDYLNGGPGIYSARYETTPQKRIDKLLSALKEDNERNAHFTCALCLVDKNGEIVHKETGKVYGKIAHEQKGEGGFGYDPVFIVENLNKTMAELTEVEKNTLSHRGKALLNMLKWVQENINEV